MVDFQANFSLYMTMIKNYVLMSFKQVENVLLYENNKQTMIVFEKRR